MDSHGVHPNIGRWKPSACKSYICPPLGPITNPFHFWLQLPFARHHGYAAMALFTEQGSMLSQPAGGLLWRWTIYFRSPEWDIREYAGTRSCLLCSVMQAAVEVFGYPAGGEWLQPLEECRSRPCQQGWPKNPAVLLTQHLLLLTEVSRKELMGGGLPWENRCCQEENEQGRKPFWGPVGFTFQAEIHLSGWGQDLLLHVIQYECQSWLKPQQHWQEAGSFPPISCDCLGLSPSFWGSPSGAAI